MATKRWAVTQVESDPEAANMNESTLFLTINPNKVATEEQVLAFREIIRYLTEEKLDQVLTLKQEDVVSGYDTLAEYLVGDVKVSVKYEIGPRFSRQHVHISLQALLRDRGSMMHIDLAKLRDYLAEQLGYRAHVNVRAVQNSHFNIDRYIRK